MSEAVEQTDDLELMPNRILAFCECSIQAVNKGTREIGHLITTASVDRIGDVVEPSGADLANYMKHPVVMVDHAYSVEKIIGKATALEITAKGIYARTQYRDTPLARDAFNLAADGLGAWSIGFRPIEFNTLKDDKGRSKGFHFTKWEMLEYSQVAIPMNPDAVQNAVTRGLLAAEHVKTFFRIVPAEHADGGSDRTHAEPEAVAVKSPSLDPRALAQFQVGLAAAERRIALAECAANVSAIYRRVCHE